MALTFRQLLALQRACGRGIDVDDDVAAALERRANRVWSAALALPLDVGDPANDGLPIPRARWSFDRLAQALGLCLIDETLPGLLVGAFVRAQGIVLVDESLRADERTPVVSHECSHADLHERAPHEEVSYLTLCFIFPALLLDELPIGRAVTPCALQQAVPYRTPVWAADYRAPILDRVSRAGAWRKIVG